MIDEVSDGQDIIYEEEQVQEDAENESFEASVTPSDSEQETGRTEDFNLDDTYVASLSFDDLQVPEMVFSGAGAGGVGLIVVLGVVACFRIFRGSS